MLKISDVIDRIFRDWLYPPDYLPTQTSLTDDIDDSTLTIPYNGLIITPEELELVGGGTLVEIGSESIIISSVNQESETFTASTRGANNTTPSPHSSGDQIIISPPFYRRSIFDTISDTLVSYYPSLYAVRMTQELSMEGSIITIPSTAHIPVELFLQHSNNWVSVPFNHFNFFPGVPTNNALTIARSSSFSSKAFLVYHGPFQAPQTEDETLKSLGFRDEWAKLLTVSSVLHLIGGRDIDTISQTHISQVLQAEFQPARNTSIRRDMLQYENILLERAKATLYAASNIPMSFHAGI